ncbi:MAG: enoyl-CoA hydratase/isomerase family protein [Pseudomonadota bacterium]|jgi:enoyl-CoA hydratase
MTEATILARVEHGVGRITLNRPAALHALNTDMCRRIIDALQGWKHDPTVKLVLFDHAGERGFCAGGDIRMLAESGAGDAVKAREFFFIEYRMNALLQAYPKTCVALMDGVVMGGGVGISLPCKVRVATERTTFAMPETGIGLFPDVGGGWWLPRLPGKAGLWLALTGARIKWADCRALGLATHTVASSDVETLKADILAEPDQLDAILARHAAEPGPSPLRPHREALDRLFGGPSVEAIFADLEADGSDWAKAQLATLKSKSPQTMKVAFRQLSLGGAMTAFADNMAMEYRIGSRVVRRHDFLEGVRAVIIDKDNAPRWSPASLAEVSETLLDDIFAPLPPAEEWTPLND